MFLLNNLLVSFKYMQIQGEMGMGRDRNGCSGTNRIGEMVVSPHVVDGHLRWSLVFDGVEGQFFPNIHSCLNSIQSFMAEVAAFRVRREATDLKRLYQSDYFERVPDGEAKHDAQRAP